MNPENLLEQNVNRLSNNFERLCIVRRYDAVFAGIVFIEFCNKVL